MTPQARTGAPFELLRFEAVPISATLVVLELEGRFRPSTRFGRAPVLVVEPGGGERRAELTPVRTAVAGDRWHAAYAAPVEALSPDARLALGVRGTLLELPAPDEPDDGERLTALAREANRLRRGLEAAEDEAGAARADAAAARAELAAAVTAARDEARAQSAERIDALEREVVEAHRLAASDAEEARVERDAAIAAAVAETTREHQQAVAAATARAEDAERRATEAEQRAAELEAKTGDAETALTAEMASLVDAEARASEADQQLKVANEGVEVLRAELAEERRRAQETIAELTREVQEARSAPATPDDRTEVAAPGDDAPGDDDDVAPAAPDAETRVVRGSFGEDLDPTRPFTVAEHRDADDDATQPVTPRPEPARPREATLRDLLTPDHADTPRHGPNLSPWIAVGALLLFAFVLVGLLAGFLG